MNEQRKEKYETPVTKHVQVEVENSICAASVTPNPGDNVKTDRHVDINQQIDGGEIDFTKGETWD
ncbi:MAG: hypothetical protein E7K36_15960 [Bacteroides sp.]|nr:hypothetical protein [Bacteroides sp.]